MHFTITQTHTHWSTTDALHNNTNTHTGPLYHTGPLTEEDKQLAEKLSHAQIVFEMYL